MCLLLSIGDRGFPSAFTLTVASMSFGCSFTFLFFDLVLILMQQHTPQQTRQSRKTIPEIIKLNSSTVKPTISTSLTKVLKSLSRVSAAVMNSDSVSFKAFSVALLTTSDSASFTIPPPLEEEFEEVEFSLFKVSGVVASFG